MAASQRLLNPQLQLPTLNPRSHAHDSQPATLQSQARHDRRHQEQTRPQLRIRTCNELRPLWQTHEQETPARPLQTRSQVLKRAIQQRENSNGKRPEQQTTRNLPRKLSRSAVRNRNAFRLRRTGLQLLRFEFRSRESLGEQQKPVLAENSDGVGPVDWDAGDQWASIGHFECCSCFD